MTEQNETEHAKMSIPLVEKLMEAEYQRGRREGMDSAKSLRLDASGYSSGQHSIGIISAKTRRELSRKVKDHYWRDSGDNPGQAYMVS